MYFHDSFIYLYELFENNSQCIIYIYIDSLIDKNHFILCIPFQKERKTKKKEEKLSHYHIRFTSSNCNTKVNLWSLFALLQEFIKLESIFDLMNSLNIICIFEKEEEEERMFWWYRISIKYSMNFRKKKTKTE